MIYRHVHGELAALFINDLVPLKNVMISVQGLNPYFIHFMFEYRGFMSYLIPYSLLCYPEMRIQLYLRMHIVFLLVNSGIWMCDTVKQIQTV
jgi:hypothetical protein